MKRRLNFFFLIYCFSANILFAQQNYGNEWIKPQQKYLKIKIEENGLFGISYQQLFDAGLISQAVNSETLQIFNKGIEIPLYLTGNEDQFFNNGDRIVFYGQTNDAGLDKVLYTDQSFLPNEQVNLFESANYYFITYAPNATGKRYQLTETPTGPSIAQDYILYQTRINLSTTYYPGELIIEGLSLSEFNEGEGYLGNTFGKGQSLNFNIQTPNYSGTYQSQNKISFYVAGRSNAASANSSGQNHHLRISVGGKTAFDTLFRAYKTVRKTLPVIINNSSTSVLFSSIDDLGAATDFQAPAYIDITYARNLSLGNAIKEIRFDIPAQTQNSTLEFNEVYLSAPLLFNLSQSTCQTGTISNSDLQFSIPAHSENSFYLGDLSQLKATYPEMVTFRSFKPQDIQTFLLISNRALQDGANSYLNYNQTTRNIATTLAFTDDLYNEFYYGFHHPLAIRNFCKWAIDNGATKPEYLFLLGKGYETPKNNLQNDLVPTFGYPASDNMLTAGLTTTTLEPALTTGRLPAKNNTDIDNYLKKLRIYENLPDSLWRKKLIHVTGGKSASEANTFQSYLNTYFNNVKGEKFGASVVNFHKDVSDAVTENLTEGIMRETRKGAAMISFLGHGSSLLTEVALGTPQELNNAEKPAIYMVNGCSTGNAFTSADSYSEQFILQKDYGAIAWLGTTSSGIASNLFNFSNAIYLNCFKNYYGQSIAYSLKQAIKTVGNSNDKYNLAHARQYNFIGDPYIRLMSPAKPDYAMKPQSVFLTPALQNASQPSLKFSFVVRNYGKALSDSLEVKITRTLPNNSTLNYQFKIKPVYNTDTVMYELNNLGLAIEGDNKLTITLDPDKKLDDSSYDNNNTELQLFLAGNSVNAIFPLKNSLSNSLTLIGEADNLFTTEERYVFEIDTIADFSSAFKKTSPVIQAGLLPSWTPIFSPKNNKTYFWRIKLEDGHAWSESVFTYLSDDRQGYTLTQSGQIKPENLNLDHITIDPETKQFQFEQDLFSTNISSRGDDIPISVAERRLRINPNEAISYVPTESTGITMASFNPIIKGELFSYPSPYNSSNGPKVVNGYTGQYFWNTNNSIELDSLVSYINQLPNGYYVMGVNNYNCSPKDFPEYVKEALRSIGLAKFDLVGNGEPYAFWGVKGSTPGSALEYTADYSSTIPARSQVFRYFNDLVYRVDEGFIVGEKIGPAKSWKKASSNFQNRLSDELSYSVIGVDTNGNESVITGNSAINEIDLSPVNAETYPYIRIKTNFKNPVLRNLPPFISWQAEYEPLPELTLKPGNPLVSDLEEIQIGDSLNLTIGIKNLSKTEKTDSVKINYTITGKNNDVYKKSFKAKPLLAGDSTLINIKEQTLSFVGKNIFKVSLEDKDNYSFNNFLNYTFEVVSDSKEPQIDITFDGKRIINGEIVSAKPIILISSTDENKFLLQNDTSLVNIFVKMPDGETYKRVYFSDGLLKIASEGKSDANQLVIQYNPTFETDGIYSLKITSKDVVGNINKELITDFEIVTESSITHFYPYPNPVVNATRFVFTLTGSKVPDQLKIQIFNASGKIVREIFKEQLGPLKIGNNISDFSWDGTDEFGSRLANGVYFYQVIISDQTERFNHRNTSGDKFFKNNLGKLYLMR